MAVAATTPVYNDNEKDTCRIALTSKQFGPVVASTLIDASMDRIAFLAINNEYGRGMVENISRNMSKNNQENIITEYYESTAVDFKTQISKLVAKNSDIDALFVINPSASVEPMFQQLKSLGWNKPIASDYYTIQNPNMKNLSLAEGVMIFDYDYTRAIRDTDTAQQQLFKKTYKERFGKDPVFIAAATYDALLIMAEGLRNGTHDNPSSAGQYISSLKDYRGITGTLAFDNDCEVSRTIKLRKVLNASIVDM
jgi:branched-chain amino acid transport system substrate-binding protein